MKKKPITILVGDEEIELSQTFLDFYRKETGHSNITKKGVAKFLNNLVKQHLHEKFTECCS